MKKLVRDLEPVYDLSLTAGIGERDPEKTAELRRLNPPIAHPAMYNSPKLVKINSQSGRFGFRLPSRRGAACEADSFQHDAAKSSNVVCGPTSKNASIPSDARLVTH